MSIDNLLNMSVNGKTKLYGLIGDPVEHTISPQIHNSLAEALGINMVYVPLHVIGENLGAAVNGLKALGFGGFNITIPYKEKVMEYLDEIDATAIAYDAVNTVFVNNGRLLGYNTDADGFYRAFTEAFRCEVKNLSVLIIGAGGAANSIAYILADKGAGSVTIANRTIENAEKICERIRSTYRNRLETAVLNDDMDISSYDVIINTTSVGMYPKTDDTVLKNAAFKKEQMVIDIIYNPVETLFLKRAASSGAKTLNGFGMLYYQAVIAFEIWNSIRIPKDIERKLYEEFSSKLEKIL
jgi:shikimate 5-dehydrogenase